MIYSYLFVCLFVFVLEITLNSPKVFPCYTFSPHLHEITMTPWSEFCLLILLTENLKLLYCPHMVKGDYPNTIFSLSPPSHMITSTIRYLPTPTTCNSLLLPKITRYHLQPPSQKTEQPPHPFF